MFLKFSKQRLSCYYIYCRLQESSVDLNVFLSQHDLNEYGDQSPPSVKSLAVPIIYLSIHCIASMSNADIKCSTRGLIKTCVPPYAYGENINGTLNFGIQTEKIGRQPQEKLGHKVPQEGGWEISRRDPGLDL